jgi:hypothetical protein
MKRASTRLVDLDTVHLRPEALQARRLARHRMATLASVVAVATAGLGFAGATAAAGSPTSVVSVSIAAKTRNPIVTGDIWTAYGVPTYDSAVVSGKVSGAPAQADVQLMARVFPYKAAGKVAGSAVLGSSARYSFTVMPHVATRYWLEVFKPGAHSAPVGASKAVVVYATLGATFVPDVAESCSRPVCHEHFEVFVRIPESVAKYEAVKPWYAYFAVALAPVTEPKAPKEIDLTKNFKLGKVRKVNDNEYKFSVAFSFRINDEAYNFTWGLCTKDTEAKDGMGLPGSHGCGLKRIPADSPYLG